MGILTDIFAADPDQLSQLQDEEAIPQDLFDTVEAKSIDPVKIAQLQTIVEGKPFDEAIGECDLAYAVSETDGPWVMRFPASLAARLVAATPEELKRFGDRWASIEEFKLDRWPAEAVHGVLSDIAALAHRAAKRNHSL